MTSSLSFGDSNAGLQAGTINGPVSTTFNLAPAQPEIRPQPLILIPFARDADFVERGSTLEQVHGKCAVPGSRVALVGLGGVGSQLAIEYAYRTRERSPKTWVFWVHASNAARFEQSFRDIAGCANIAGWQDPRANIFKLVHDWLRDSREQWLLMLDNVDDAQFLVDSEASRTQGATRPLCEYLPYCERGSILITTRNREAALYLVEPRDLVAVDPMDDAQAIALFKKKLGRQEDSGEITELAAALEYMPLAITQAAAYISQRAPRFSVAQYLEDFKQSDREKTSLLDHEAGQLRRDREAKNSIIITWQISFEHLRKTKPSAADLLSLMSFFGRQGIPEALLHGQGEDEEDEQRTPKETSRMRRLRRFFSGKPSLVETRKDSEKSKDQGGCFERDIVALRDFCFISANDDGKTFGMHSLVQLATRRWLAANGKLEKWRRHFIRNLRIAFPIGEYQNWAVCQGLFAHAKSAATQQPEGTPALIDWATILYRASWYAWRKGSPAEAETLAMQSMKVRQKVLGPDHVKTLSSTTMAAYACVLGGRYDAAEALQTQVTEISKKKLGADHELTLTSMANLAITYRNQGRWAEAETLELEILRNRKKNLGPDHSHTLTSMANLALTYGKQGRVNEAVELQERVQKARKEQLGPNHPETLTTMHNLAYTYKKLGRDALAISLMKECIDRRKRILRDDHPDLVFSIEWLAQWEAEAETMAGHSEVESVFM